MLFQVYKDITWASVHMFSKFYLVDVQASSDARVEAPRLSLKLSTMWDLAGGDFLAFSIIDLDSNAVEPATVKEGG